MYSERPQGSAWSDLLAENAQMLSILAFFMACLVFFSLGSSNFPTVANILNILRQAAPILVVAVAMTFVIVTAGIDLSVGSTVALVNAVCALLLAAGLPWVPVVIAMLAFGAAVGLLQGWFIAYEGIPAFIVTLAGLSILRGVGVIARACISREFRAFAADASSPVIDWLRALSAHAHPVCGGREHSRVAE
jgi:simple sugar transport system permease protein